jgi:hypothetical protein
MSYEEEDTCSKVSSCKVSCSKVSCGKVKLISYKKSGKVKLVLVMLIKKR